MVVACTRPDTRIWLVTAAGVTDDRAVGVEVRPLAEHDAVAVAVLREQVAAEDRWIGEAPPEDRDHQVERLRAGITSPDVGSFVAVLADEAIGSAGVVNTGGRGELGMMIARGHRGQGIGRQLLRHALAWAKSAGCHKVVLEVWPHNDRAIGLYESAGFSQEGLRTRHHRRRDGSLWDSIEMGLILDTTSPGCPHRSARHKPRWADARSAPYRQSGTVRCSVQHRL